MLTSVFFLFVCLFCGSVSGLFLFSWGGHPQGYGGSQARGQIAAATVLDLRHICDLHPSSRQCQILKPLSEARDGICNLLVPGGFVSTVSRGELLLIHSPFQSWHLLIPKPAPNPLPPLGNHKSVLHVCELVSVVYTGSFVPDFKVQI